MNVTLITGASGGIGEAFARRLAAEKHNLLLVARQETKLHQLSDELTRVHGITAQYIVIDLTEPDADRRIFEETEKRGLTVNFLINNAGIGSAGDFARLDLTAERNMITLNVTALMALTHRYLPAMRAHKSGTIINVASMAGFQPIPFITTYAATKAFVRSFTEAIVEENRPFGVRVMLLAPGATETNFFGAANIGSKGDIGVSATQTPDQVVKTAMNGLRRNKGVAISGFSNKLAFRLGSLIPNSLITRSLAKQFRPNFVFENN